MNFTVILKLMWLVIHEDGQSRKEVSFKKKLKGHIKALLLWLFCFSFLSFARKNEKIAL